MKNLRYFAGLALMVVPTLAIASSVEEQQTQLEFFAGDWVLYSADGDVIGTSRINSQVPGTMLFEQRTVGAKPVQPLWFENAERNNGWTQLFIGPNGQTREFITQSMPGTWPLVMGAKVKLQDGSMAVFKMTITKKSDDVSNRVLEISRDGEASWTEIFAYRYQRKN